VRVWRTVPNVKHSWNAGDKVRQIAFINCYATVMLRADTDSLAFLHRALWLNLGLKEFAFFANG